MLRRYRNDGLERVPNATHPPCQKSTVTSKKTEFSKAHPMMSNRNTHNLYDLIVHKQRFQWHNALDEKGLRVAKLEVHDGHDSQTDELRRCLLSDLLEIIVSVGSNDRCTWFSLSNNRRPQNSWNRVAWLTRSGSSA